MTDGKTSLEKLTDWLSEQKLAGLVDFKEFFEPGQEMSVEQRARDILELLTTDGGEVVISARPPGDGVSGR